MRPMGGQRRGGRSSSIVDKPAPPCLDLAVLPSEPLEPTSRDILEMRKQVREHNAEMQRLEEAGDTVLAEFSRGQGLEQAKTVAEKLPSLEPTEEGLKTETCPDSIPDSCRGVDGVGGACCSMCLYLDGLSPSLA